MTKLHEILEVLIAKNGYSVYQLAYKSDINRSTLQKIVAGQRKLTQEVYDKIIPFFQLTPMEQEELDNAFLIQQIGEERYTCHMYIKHLIEAPIEIPEQPHFPNEPNELIDKVEFSNSFILTDKYQIMNLIYLLLRKNAQTYSHPYLYTFLDYHNDYMPSLHRQLKSDLFKNLTITHLVEFSKQQNEGTNYNNLHNLQTLSYLLSFLPACTSPFSIHYYYTNQHAAEQGALIFPYYIILDDYVILLSRDYNKAYLIADKAIHEYYLQCYRNALGQAHTLTDGIMPYTSLLGYLIQNDSDSNYSLCLNVLPALELFITEEMIDKYMLDCEEAELLREQFIYRLSQLNAKKFEALESGSASFFTREGLELFARAGKFVNIPSSLAAPLDIEDRIQILEQLLALNQTTNYFYMLNESRITTTNILHLVPIPPNNLLFVLTLSDEEVAIIDLSEHTLYHSVVDFITTLPTYGFCLTTEETNAVIQRTIDELKELLETS